MKATQLLHNLGQSIWLDNITRDLLDQGTLKRYIDELSVTGLTSNPTIFEHAIKNSASYDVPIREKLAAGRSGEDLFFDLALEDITRAADLFLPIHEKTNGVDGWVSLEVSPLLAHDTESTLRAAKALFGLRPLPVAGVDHTQRVVGLGEQRVDLDRFLGRHPHLRQFLRVVKKALSRTGSIGRGQAGIRRRKQRILLDDLLINTFSLYSEPALALVWDGTGVEVKIISFDTGFIPSPAASQCQPQIIDNLERDLVLDSEHILQRLIELP